jgi:hypothetical protein
MLAQFREQLDTIGKWKNRRLTVLSGQARSGADSTIDRLPRISGLFAKVDSRLSNAERHPNSLKRRMESGF